jgi:hypothetical protein
LLLEKRGQEKKRKKNFRLKRGRKRERKVRVPWADTGPLQTGGRMPGIMLVSPLAGAEQKSIFFGTASEPALSRMPPKKASGIFALAAMLRHAYMRKKGIFDRKQIVIPAKASACGP